DRQRMDACSQFVRQKRVDRAVTFYPVHVREGRRHDTDTEMGFTRAVERLVVAGLRMVMSCVQVAFVDDGEAFRVKRRGKLRFDRGLDGQGRFPSPYEGGLTPPGIVSIHAVGGSSRKCQFLYRTAKRP